MDKQFMAGGDLMIAPVYKQGATSQAVYFPGTEPWYDVDDGAAHAGGTDATVSAPMDKIPAYQRGGSIVPRQMRARRSSVQMANDPFTLTIAPDAEGGAVGRLYLDAGDGYEYRQGAYAYRKFSYAPSTGPAVPATLSSLALHSDPSYSPPNELERIELLASPTAAAKLAKVTLEVKGETRTLDFRYVQATGRLVVRAPKVGVAEDWKMAFSFA